MPMWFAHFRCARGLLPGDPVNLLWGALCPDVDKISSIPRRMSHLGGRDRALEPARFLASLGLDRDRARPHLHFLCGYLSHLALDDAWYGTLYENRLSPNWTETTTRAATLLWDLEARLDVTPPDLLPARGEHMVSFLTPDAVRTLRKAAHMYLSWDGNLEPVPGQLREISAWKVSFSQMLSQERARAEPALARIPREETWARLQDRARVAVERLVEHVQAAE